MPCKTIQEQRQYQKIWMEKRRREFFDGKLCAWCGSMECLELHHLNKVEKENHRIWSWSKHRRVVELNKCIVLCRKCHLQHHAKEKRIPKATALKIRQECLKGEAQKKVAQRFNVSLTTVNRIHTKRGAYIDEGVQGEDDEKH